MQYYLMVAAAVVLLAVDFTLSKQYQRKAGSSMKAGLRFNAIIGGFAIRSRPLRLYGLILTLLAVLKLVLIDTGSLATVTRILSFLAGGLICFAISALYTYLEKKLLKQPSTGGKIEDSSMDTTETKGDTEL